jgi:Domain of unknown function (DUF4158)
VPRLFVCSPILSGRAQSRFPRGISRAGLLASFSLFDGELGLIGDRRGDHNRLGFGVQFKTLPYLGFVPDDLTNAPTRVVFNPALQLARRPSLEW